MCVCAQERVAKVAHQKGIFYIYPEWDLFILTLFALVGTLRRFGDNMNVSSPQALGSAIMHINNMCNKYRHSHSRAPTLAGAAAQISGKRPP